MSCAQSDENILLIDISVSLTSKCFPCGDAVSKSSSLNLEPFGTSETDDMFARQIKNRSKSVGV